MSSHPLFHAGGTRRRATALALGVVAALGVAKAEEDDRWTLRAADHFVRGINLSGGEFASHALPGRYGYDYVFPGANLYDRSADMNMQVVRLPVRWERVQHRLGDGLDGREMTRIDQAVIRAEERGMLLVLDLHNYGRYRGQKATEGKVEDGLADVWRRIAIRYRDRDVAFNLMNEPFGIEARAWRKIVDKTVLAIRNTGAKNLIMVPGSHWSGAHGWMTERPGGSNAQAFAGFTDPADNFVFDMHQYVDPNGSGTLRECLSPDKVARKLDGATRWLRQQNAKAFIGEFAAPGSPDCLESLKMLMETVEDAPDAFMGWAYWSAGEWWGDDYMFNMFGTTWPAKVRRKMMREHLSRPVDLD